MKTIRRSTQILAVFAFVASVSGQQQPQVQYGNPSATTPAAEIITTTPCHTDTTAPPAMTEAPLPAVIPEPAIIEPVASTTTTPCETATPVVEIPEPAIIPAEPPAYQAPVPPPVPAPAPPTYAPPPVVVPPPAPQPPSTYDKPTYDLPMDPGTALPPPPPPVSAPPPPAPAKEPCPEDQNTNAYAPTDPGISSSDPAMPVSESGPAPDMPADPGMAAGMPSDSTHGSYEDLPVCEDLEGEGEEVEPVTPEQFAAEQAAGGGAAPGAEARMASDSPDLGEVGGENSSTNGTLSADGEFGDPSIPPNPEDVEAAKQSVSGDLPEFDGNVASLSDKPSGALKLHSSLAAVAVSFAALLI